MTTLRRLILMGVAALLAFSCALAQESADESDDAAWSFYASVYGYIVPGEDDYLQPTVTADWNELHLEARYNYEGFHTTSIWAGVNFSVGEKVTFEGTGMVGGVYGDTAGIAPGFKATLTWTKLVFYTEAEYLFDSNDSADSYFYAWSELSWAPADWCRVGLAGQRTKVYKTDRDIQRGVLVGFSFKHMDVTAYGFNLDEHSPTAVVALGVSF